MEGSEFEQSGFFTAIQREGARALLIGRQALVALGLPLQTRDYDFWIHADDAALFNTAAEPFGLYPNRSPEEARATGRYVLENDEHVDVLIAQAFTTLDGMRLAFDDAWSRRRELLLGDGSSVFVPSLEDLILTKRIAARPRDAEDVRLLELLREEEKPK